MKPGAVAYIGGVATVDASLGAYCLKRGSGSQKVIILSRERTPGCLGVPFHFKGSFIVWETPSVDESGVDFTPNNPVTPQ